MVVGTGTGVVVTGGSLVVVGATVVVLGVVVLVVVVLVLLGAGVVEVEVEFSIGGLLNSASFRLMEDCERTERKQRIRVLFITVSIFGDLPFVF